MPKEFLEPVLVADSKGLHIASADVSAALEKKNLSPSMITGLEGCHARWVADTFVMRDLLEEEPDNAARRGSLFHKVMEEFFTLEPEERTTTRMKEMVAQVLDSAEFKDMNQYPEAIQWLREAINNYYRMGAKPQKVEIAKLPDKYKGGEKLGLEIFVKGQLGESKRPILGFIDRLVVDQRNKETNGIFIEDWKSGGKAKVWNPKTKSDEGLAEARQQVIYSMLLKQDGYNVTGARLIFPSAKDKKTGEYAPTIVNVDINDESFNQKVLDSITETDKKLDMLIDENTFEYKPDFLCSWCSLARACPRATVKSFQKAQDAYASQPDPSILAKGIYFQ